MTLTYEVLSVLGNQATVRFINEENLSYIKVINVPASVNGDVNSIEFRDVINSQMVGIEYKVNEGMIVFSGYSDPIIPS
jgi:hypothetical protein